jgi:RNA polymerase sigma-70 factor (ECF subfamily)
LYNLSDNYRKYSLQGAYVNYASWDDQQLMAGISGSQTGALAELYDRYSRLVYSLAIRSLGEDTLAEEVTQDVFMQAWNKAGLYDSSQGKVSTWLCSMARNRSIDMLRRQGVRPEGHRAAFEDGVVQPENDPEVLERSVELRIQKERVRTAMSGLPSEQRDVLELAYFQGMSQQEIASALNQPLGTVKTRVRLAMQKLRQVLVENSISTG